MRRRAPSGPVGNRMRLSRDWRILIWAFSGLLSEQWALGPLIVRVHRGSDRGNSKSFDHFRSGCGRGRGGYGRGCGGGRGGVHTHTCDLPAFDTPCRSCVLFEWGCWPGWNLNDSHIFNWPYLKYILFFCRSNPNPTLPYFHTRTSPCLKKNTYALVRLR